MSETTAIFEEMLVALEEGQRHCLRVKLDMSAPNKALRDPVAYRCNLEPHWRTGQKYKVCARWQVGDLGHRPHFMRSRAAETRWMSWVRRNLMLASIAEVMPSCWIQCHCLSSAPPYHFP